MPGQGGRYPENRQRVNGLVHECLRVCCGATMVNLDGPGHILLKFCFLVPCDREKGAVADQRDLQGGTDARARGDSMPGRISAPVLSGNSSPMRSSGEAIAPLGVRSAPLSSSPTSFTGEGAVRSARRDAGVARALGRRIAEATCCVLGKDETHRELLPRR